jgi:hypothetical protein
MENANSRQTIMQRLLNAATSLLRRTGIWDKFKVLVQGFKDAVGFGASNLTAYFLAMDTNTTL